MCLRLGNLPRWVGERKNLPANAGDKGCIPGSGRSPGGGNGNPLLLSIQEDGTIEVINERDCSLADIDGDYLYETDNSLYRIQADEPISEDTYEEVWDCYNEHNKDWRVKSETPCDSGECPYDAQSSWDCRACCGLGVFE